MLGISDFGSALWGAIVGGVLAAAGAIVAAYFTVRWQTPKAVDAAVQAYRTQQGSDAATRLVAEIFDPGHSS